MKENIKNKYNIEKAIQRIAWRFTTDKSFKPNENDIDSVNCLIDWINRQTSETIKNNQLFAKLYIYHLNQSIRYFQTTVFEDIPQKDLSKLLDLPLKNFYIAFHKELHSNLISKVVEDNEGRKVIDVKELEEKYDLQFVSDKLEQKVNEALNRFS